MADEIILNAHWAGPFPASAVPLDDRHVLYAVFGTHWSQGPGALLYIGQSKRGAGFRLREHEWWMKAECDEPAVRIASLGILKSWREWSEDVSYERPENREIDAAEALLICAQAPPYNSVNKSGCAAAKDRRLFNTGRHGILLPEISHRRLADDPW